MGRGVSSGGGQSSLGYLFGSGEAPKPTTNTTEVPKNQGEVANNGAPRKTVPVALPPNVNKEIPAGVPANNANNYSGYLFGSGEAPKPTINTTEVAKNQGEVANNEAPRKIAPVALPPNVSKEIPAGVPANNANNYFRVDGQNCGNFLTDRPTTKVHAAPGGGSSLDYLFGGDGK